MGVSQSRTTRREFLSGKSAIQAAQDALPDDAPPAAAAAASEPAESYLVQVGRTAMACDFEIFLNAGQHPGATERALEALDLVDALESQMTIYRSTSEVIEINRRAAAQPVTVERRLFGLLQRGYELSQQTDGAFDMTSGPLTRLWNTVRREARLPAPDVVADALSRVGSRWLELDPASATIRFQRPGTEINLNAIGKGHALDRCSELLQAAGVENFLIHGGKSSVLARGSRALSESQGRGWLVSIKHPFKTSQTLIELWLLHRAVGTSGSANQYFHYQGKRYGHVIDPRTGWPPEGMLSATVVTSSAADADALATAMFVMGLDESVQYCRSHSETGCILVRSGSRSGEIEVHVCGLDRDAWRLIHDSASPEISLIRHE